MAKKTELEKQLEELDKLRAKGTLSDTEYEGARAAMVARTSATVQVKGGAGAGGIFKWGFFGCIGMFAAIIAVIVVIAVAISAAAGGGDDGATAAKPGQVGTNKGDKHVPFAANASDEIAPDGNPNKKVRVTILQTADNIVSKNQFSKPAAGMKWYGVEVVVEDSGTAEVSSPDWKLRATNDGEYDRAFLVEGPGPDLDVIFTLTPGGKKQGWIYFEIPVDAGPKWLRADPNPFLKNDLYFDAK
ncbi:MAG: DUF4352 domain-containing protein [Chloroflexi bacterium]|nr:DUF4352 domain-containing protein [Chloroflexota bacterium]